MVCGLQCKVHVLLGSLLGANQELSVSPVGNDLRITRNGKPGDKRSRVTTRRLLRSPD